MSTRAQSLADNFERINTEVIAAVEGCSDTQWRVACGSDPRSVGVVAHHVAGTHGVFAQLIGAFAVGQSVSAPTAEQIDAGNAQHAASNAGCTKSETLALLRDNGATASSVVRALTDEQLDRPAGPYGTTQTVIEHLLIGHAQTHLESIKALSPA